MSKLTTRDYKNIAKRPTKRGHGRAVLRSVPEVEEVSVDEALDLVDEAEQDLTELGEGEAEVDASRVDAAMDADNPAAIAPKYEQPQALGSIDEGNALK